MPFVIDLDPVALSLAGVDIRWYGLLLVAAITVAYAVAQREAGRRFLPPATVADGSLWVGLAALAGGRALYVLQNGLGDLDAGRVLSDGDLGRRLDARFGAVSKPTKKK